MGWAVASYPGPFSNGPGYEARVGGGDSALRGDSLPKGRVSPGNALSYSDCPGRHLEGGGGGQPALLHRVSCR